MSAGSASLRDLLSRFNLRGKGAIITGAAGAFGRACALTLGALGGKLVLISGSDGELQAVKAGVQAVGGEVVTLVRCPDSVEDANAIRDFARKSFGRIDQLVIASGYDKAGFIPVCRWRV